MTSLPVLHDPAGNHDLGHVAALQGHGAAHSHDQRHDPDNCRPGYDNDGPPDYYDDSPDDYDDARYDYHDSRCDYDNPLNDNHNPLNDHHNPSPNHHDSGDHHYIAGYNDHSPADNNNHSPPYDHNFLTTPLRIGQPPLRRRSRFRQQLRGRVGLRRAPLPCATEVGATEVGAREVGAAIAAAGPGAPIFVVPGGLTVGGGSGVALGEGCPTPAASMAEFGIFRTPSSVRSVT